MTKDGGPAFPCPMGADWPECDRGLSLRDYFAAKAMHAAIVSDSVSQAIRVLAKQDGAEPAELTVRYAYQWADAMLAERARTQEQP